MPANGPFLSVAGIAPHLSTSQCFYPSTKNIRSKEFVGGADIIHNSQLDNHLHHTTFHLTHLNTHSSSWPNTHTSFSASRTLSWTSRVKGE